jgi:NAD(P)-dependent dehydrogenase (short-subunit alcohol dehydrogenase family)
MTKGLFDLKGKVALVTGGNSGLGLGFARGIAKQGGDVVIWGRRADKNAAAKKELESFGVRVAAREVDVSSEEAVIAGYKALKDQFGRIDCVFANAGPPPTTNSSLDDLTTKHWHEFLGVAFHGAFYTLREGARLMVDRAKAGEPGGSLVFCGSLSMFKGLAGKPQYAASKAGMGAVIRAFAVEFAKYGIRANTIAPGLIRTDIGGSESKEHDQMFKYFASKIPMGRVGLPADFEGIAAYLASDASSFHTGDTIVIDGADLINLGY